MAESFSPKNEGKDDFGKVFSQALLRFLIQTGNARLK
jgi:hypothetical protein